jgi:CRISPR/Cas system CMR subunit Cmr4 (Cas7 group RAMP superfamily)
VRLDQGRAECPFQWTQSTFKNYFLSSPLEKSRRKMVVVGDECIRDTRTRTRDIKES